VIPQRLFSLVEILVEGGYLGMLLENVVNHRVHFMGQKHPELLSNDLDAESVNRTDDGFVFVVERFQPGVNVVPQLSGDYPVKRDDQDVTPINREPVGVKKPLDTTNQAERFAAPRASDTADRLRI
jgi:hypothetical protein